MPPKAAPAANPFLGNRLNDLWNVGGMMPGLHANTTGNMRFETTVVLPALARIWPTATAAHRTRIRAWFARWGPTSQPSLPAYGEELLRAKCWRDDVRQFPKCNTCFAANTPMPDVANCPLGLDPGDIMPCGCQWEHGRFEQWAIGWGTFNVVQSGNKAGQPGLMGRGARGMYMRFFKEGMGGDPDIPPTYGELVNWTDRNNALIAAKGPNFTTGANLWAVFE